MNRALLPTLADCRDELDRTDEELSALLAHRMTVCRHVAHLKKRDGVPMMNPGRIRVVQDRARRLAAAHSEDPQFFLDVFDRVVAEACRIEDSIIDDSPTAPGGD